MSDDPDPDKLEQLGDRIANARDAQAAPRPTHRHHTDVGQVWRMVIELVTGIGVGFGVGYGLDIMFGTLPIFLMFFTLFGFAAGVRVMIGTATELAKAKDAARDGTAADG